MCICAKRGCVTLLLLLTACVHTANETPSSGESPSAGGHHLSKEEFAAIPTAFPTVYLPPKRVDLQQLYEGAKAMQNPERIAWLVSALLRLDSVQVRITLKECGAAEAFYNKRNRQITICYEFLAFANLLLSEDPAKQYEFNDQTSAILMFTALHEIGHSLIDVLELRFGGNEEDVVDRFAILLALAADDETLATRFVSTPAALFEHHGKQVEIAGGHRATDTHSTSQKRALDAKCLLYGRYKTRALEESLGNRVQQCRGLYTAAKQSWNTALRSYSRVKSGRTF